VDLYQRARAARPDDPDIAATSARRWLGRRLRRGLAIDAALALEPHRTSAQFNRALTLTTFGRREEARRLQQPSPSGRPTRSGPGTREALAAL
jgi:hypothetical protein